MNPEEIKLPFNDKKEEPYEFNVSERNLRTYQQSKRIGLTFSDDPGAKSSDIE